MFEPAEDYNRVQCPAHWRDRIVEYKGYSTLESCEGDYIRISDDTKIAMICEGPCPFNQEYLERRFQGLIDSIGRAENTWGYGTIDDDKWPVEITINSEGDCTPTGGFSGTTVVASRPRAYICTVGNQQRNIEGQNDLDFLDVIGQADPLTIHELSHIYVNESAVIYNYVLDEAYAQLYAWLAMLPPESEERTLCNPRNDARRITSNQRVYEFNDLGSQFFYDLCDASGFDVQHLEVFNENLSRQSELEGRRLQFPEYIQVLEATIESLALGPDVDIHALLESTGIEDYMPANQHALPDLTVNPRTPFRIISPAIPERLNFYFLTMQLYNHSAQPLDSSDQIHSRFTIVHHGERFSFDRNAAFEEYWQTTPYASDLFFGFYSPLLWDLGLEPGDSFSLHVELDVTNVLEEANEENNLIEYEGLVAPGNFSDVFIESAFFEGWPPILPERLRFNVCNKGYVDSDQYFLRVQVNQGDEQFETRTRAFGPMRPTESGFSEVVRYVANFCETENVFLPEDFVLGEPMDIEATLIPVNEDSEIWELDFDNHSFRTQITLPILP